MDLVIGLTGPNAAGKGEVAAYLKERGFAIHSLSDIVREEAAAHKLPPEREHLIRVGNLLRQKGGAGVLAERILPRLRGLSIVDSIRNPVEVRVLREKLARFVLVGVKAPVGLRFRRGLSRSRPGDPRTIEEFEAREREENATDPEGQQLDATFRLADRVVDNSGSLEGLRRAVDRILAENGVSSGSRSDLLGTA